MTQAPYEGGNDVREDTNTDEHKPIAPSASTSKSWIRRIVSSSALGLKKERSSDANDDASEMPETSRMDCQSEIANMMLDEEVFQDTSEQAEGSLGELPRRNAANRESQGENAQLPGSLGGRVGHLRVDLLEARRLSAGGKLLNTKSLRPHCVAQLGETVFISDQGERVVAEGEGEKDLHRFMWHAHTGSFSFEVTDLSADLLLFMLSKNKPDNAIGHVVIPLSFLLSTDQLGLQTLWESKQTHFRSGWFEIYPLPKDGQPKFRPAAPTVSKTGMKYTPPLGFIKLACKLELDTNAPIWTLYLQPGREQVTSGEAAQKPAPTKLVNSVFAIMEASRELRRNLLRYRIAKNHIYSVHLLAIYEHVQRLRSWQNPPLSIIHCVLAVGIVKYAHVWQLPFVVFAMLVLSSVLVFRKEQLVMGWESVDKVSTSKPERAADAPDDDFIIWNNDIQDPRAALNLWQKCALAVNQLNLVQEYIGWASSILEKGINAFNFADHNASVAVLIYGFVWSCMASLALMAFSVIFSVISPTNLLLVIGIVYMLPPQARPVKQPDSSKTDPYASMKLLTLALWSRIPDTNEMGHRFIAQRQWVSALSLLWNNTSEQEVDAKTHAYQTLHRRQKTLDEVMIDRLKVIRGESEVPVEILKLQHNSSVLGSIIRDHDAQHTATILKEVNGNDTATDQELATVDLEREAMTLLRREVITQEEYHRVVAPSDQDEEGATAMPQSSISLRKEKIVSKGAHFTRKARWFIQSRLRGSHAAETSQVPTCG